MNETPDSTSSVEREQTGEPQPLFIPSFSVGGTLISSDKKHEGVGEKTQQSETKAIARHYRELFEEIRQILQPLIPTDASKKEIIDTIKLLVRDKQAGAAQEKEDAGEWTTRLQMIERADPFSSIVHIGMAADAYEAEVIVKVHNSATASLRARNDESEAEIEAAKKILRDFLDRDFDPKDTLRILATVAVNGIHWRDRMLTELRARLQAGAEKPWFYQYEPGPRWHVYFGTIETGGVIVGTESKANAIIEAHNKTLQAGAQEEGSSTQSKGRDRFMKKIDSATPETPTTSEVEKLLGQATPRPLTIEKDKIYYQVWWIIDGHDRRRGSINDCQLAKLIVLAVNALPAFLKLRQLAEKSLGLCLKHDPDRTVITFNRDELQSALSEVDSALKEKDLV